MKKIRRPINRIIAALFAVIVLLTALVIPAFAYPAENVVPPVETDVQVGDAGYDYGYLWHQSLDLSYLSEDSPTDFTFVNVDPEFNSSVTWSYVSFQLTLHNGTSNFGHYTIGMYTENGSDFFVRLGYLYTENGDTVSAFPIDAEYTPASERLLGYRLTPTDSGVFVELQYIGLDASGAVVQAEYFNSMLPGSTRVVAFDVKTEYASVWYDTIPPSDIAHTPVNLVTYQEVMDYYATHNDSYYAGYIEGIEVGTEYGYDAGYDYGYEDAQKEGTVFTSVLWDIISMPFDILANILNFELLGINLWSFVTAILSVGIIFFVLRKVGVI